jgi:hypothetical protein
VSLPLRSLAGAGIHLVAVIPAVSEPAPVVLGRGGYLSEGKAAWTPDKECREEQSNSVIPAVCGGDPSSQCQGKDSKDVANNGNEDGFPINNVAKDNLTPSSPQVVGGDLSSQ